MPVKLNRRTFLAESAAIAGGTALVFGAGVAAGNEDQSIFVGREPQLVLDDFVVEQMKGLVRTLHQPQKQGLIKETNGQDWERGDSYPAAGHVVFRDNSGKFHMTYRYLWWDPAMEKKFGADRAEWYQGTIGYASSEDGIFWHKPRLARFDGPSGYTKQTEFPFEIPTGFSKDNNLGCPIEYAYDLHENGNVENGNVTAGDRRLLIRIAGSVDTSALTSDREQRVFFASDWPDFVNDSAWVEKLHAVPGLRLTPRGNICGYDHIAQEWFSTGQDGLGSWVQRGGRDIMRQSSPDLVTWNDRELVLPVADDELRTLEHWIEYMYMDCYRVGGPKSGVWLGQLQVFDSDRTNPQYLMPTINGVWRKGITWLRLMMSRDAGKTWQRVAGKQPWLPANPEDNGYDRLVFGAPPTRVEDELRFYYGCWDGDHLCFNRDGTTFYKDRIRTNRTAWAKCRLDGYVSLDAGAGRSQLLTKPLRFHGDKLTVNLVAPRGTLRIELQDQAGRPIDGFGSADCLPVTGDGVSILVRWRKGGDVRNLAGQAVRVQFELRNASLYSFQFA